MNERIKQLAEQAGFEKQTHLIDSWECGLKELERFAELIRQAERKACANHYLQIMRDAIEGRYERT